MKDFKITIEFASGHVRRVAAFSSEAKAQHWIATHGMSNIPSVKISEFNPEVD